MKLTLIGRYDPTPRKLRLARLEFVAGGYQNQWTIGLTPRLYYRLHECDRWFACLLGVVISRKWHATLETSIALSAAIDK